MIKVIIFDLGNVILPFDFKPAAIQLTNLHNLRLKTKLSPKKFIKRIVNSDYRFKFENGTITGKEFYLIIRHKFGLKVTFSEFKSCWKDIFRLNDGIEQIITGLSKKYKLFLLSNTNSIHFDYIMKKYKIMSKFDKFYLSYKLHISKPDSKIYKTVLNNNKFNPNEYLYIDDILKYVKVAKSLGINAVQFKTSNRLRKDLNKYLNPAR
jgi:putative hydrolase of the HAD superfamily